MINISDVYANIYTCLTDIHGGCVIIPRTIDSIEIVQFPLVTVVCKKKTGRLSSGWWRNEKVEI